MSHPTHAAPAHRNRPLALAAGLLVTLALASAIVAGCGGGAKTETPPPAAEQPPTPAPPSDGASAGAPAAAVSMEAGQKSFAAKCVLCHGPAGHGDGPGSAALNPKPRNLSDKTYMSTRTDDQLAEVIRDGKGAMPAWGKAGMTEDEIRSLILYIRTLAK
jgi:mono/diheme cytochrome c family protein